MQGSISCFIRRDSTRIGTILRYVLNQRFAGHHTFCAQSRPDRCIWEMPGPRFSAICGHARPADSFILRIEDTDLERSQDRVPRAAHGRHALAGSGLGRRARISAAHPAPYCQAQRGEFYRTLYDQLQARGRAYPCYCTAEELELSRKLQRMSGKPPRYAGTCRESDGGAARRAGSSRPQAGAAICGSGDEIIEFTDAVHGPQRFASNDIGDFIIRREDGTPAFFFCNAVDDSAMGVTQVLRGDDHLTNTPRQLMLLDALGMRRPGLRPCGPAGGRGRRAACPSAMAAPACKNFANADS